jgi:hypothetical protein
MINAEHTYNMLKEVTAELDKLKDMSQAELVEYIMSSFRKELVDTAEDELRSLATTHAVFTIKEKYATK